MAFETREAIPMLRIFDVAKAREFYVDFLGCRVDWTHDGGGALPTYMQVSRAGLKLHLTEHHGDACPGGAVFLWVTGLDDLHAELTGKAYRYYRPGIEKAPYGARVMKLLDPFGNRLLFNEAHAADAVEV